MGTGSKEPPKTLYVREGEGYRLATGKEILQSAGSVRSGLRKTCVAGMSQHMTPEERSERGKKAARARWGAPKEKG